MSGWHPVRSVWSAGLFVWILCGGASSAGALNAIGVRQDGRLVEAVIPISVPTGYRTALSADGLVATIEIDRFEVVPQLDRRGAWPDPIIAVSVEKTGQGGAKLVVVARRPMAIANSSHLQNGVIAVRFETGPDEAIVPQRPIEAAPSWTQNAPPPPKEIKTAGIRTPPAKAPAGMPPRDPVVLAAQHGDAAAQLQLGTMCLAPEAPDIACARYWFERAALRGNEVAAYNLGRFAAKGMTGPSDDAEAAHWFQLSADRGYPEAEYALALLMLEGRGTPQDIARAQELLQKAGLKGFGPARRLLDDLKLQLSTSLN